MSLLKKISFAQILWLAAGLRLLAIIFSKGFGFSDDHFEVVEIAQGLLEGKKAWAEGEIYLFNLIYIYILTGIFGFCEWVGNPDPYFKMLLTRIFHGSVSMLTVYYGYKLVEKTEGKNQATIVGLLFAGFWLFPFLSVRNLREFICIPALMAAFYYLSFEQKRTKHIIIAGSCFALAFVFRLQIVFFPIGVGVYLIFRKEFKTLIILTLSTLGFLSITQFLFDYLYWGNPLASLLAYADYNANHSGEYPNAPWWHYLGTIAGLGLPILSFFLLFFSYSGRKKYPEVFWGTLFFLVFHSAFPNKQERFILPLFPFLFILGFSGIKLAQEAGNKWVLGKFYKISLWIFIISNGIALSVLTVTFSKKSRVEALYWFYKKPEIKNVVLASGGGIPFPPTFYAGHPMEFIKIESDRSLDEINKELSDKSLKPTHIILTGTKKINEAFRKLVLVFPNKKFVLEAEFEPGIVDNIAYWMNPTNNVNETWFVYSIK